MLSDEKLLGVLHDAADAVRTALGGVGDWLATGDVPGQYGIDLVADEAVGGVLGRAGVGVLSEESGLRHPDRDVVVVVDPVDGSTNASRRIPWYATSLCALDGDGPRVALVVNQASGERFEAVRGGGATCDGVAIRPTACEDVADALVALSAYPARHLGWRQYRAFGAAALDLCAVACGRFDAYVDCADDAHGPWDYLGGLLVCLEAGAVVADARGRDLIVRTHGGRRTPVAAATPALLATLTAALDPPLR